MMIPERSFSSEDYRFGVNGMEHAPEISPGAFTIYVSVNFPFFIKLNLVLLSIFNLSYF